MSPYLTFTIGSAMNCDVHLNHSSVSDIHAELVVSSSGKLFLTDRASEAGSFKKEKQKWVNFKQTYVGKNTEIRFGKYKTKGQSVLAMIAPNGICAKFEEYENSILTSLSPSNKNHYDPKNNLPTGQVRRSIHTGEIISAKEK
ncbi:MAG: FHA domain-containing protein [Pseudomonadota bacterium]|nr:FHA domain-containing protein [Pseudomonadota bacterium]